MITTTLAAVIRHRRRRADLAAALLLGSVLLGCGGQTGPAATSSANGASPVGSASAPSSPGVAETAAAPGGGGTTDACALVTSDEVQAKTGATVERTDKAATSCTWWLADDGGWIKLVVNPIDRAAFDLALAQADPVNGLGDKAFSDGATLVVLKGDTILELGSEIILSNADPAVFTRPLMEAALARL